MNPAIYIGTQEKYRYAIQVLLYGSNKRRDSFRSSVRLQRGDSAKFYVRQLSSNSDPKEITKHQAAKEKRRPKLSRQVSFQ